MWVQFLQDAIQQNLNRGIVGSAVAGVMYAFCTESEGLQHGMYAGHWCLSSSHPLTSYCRLYASFDAVNQAEIRHQPRTHQDILRLWIDHTDAHIPHELSTLVNLEFH